MREAYWCVLVLTGCLFNSELGTQNHRPALGLLDLDLDLGFPGVSVGEGGRGLLDLDLDRPRAGLGSYLTEAGVIRGRGEAERPRGDERGLALDARGLECAESLPSHVLPSAAASAAAASNFRVRYSL